MFYICLLGLNRRVHIQGLSKPTIILTMQNNTYNANSEDYDSLEVTVKEIYTLRRDGAFNQALTLSRSAHAQFPDEDSVTKAYGWTLYSICKQAIDSNELEIAQSLFENEYKSLIFIDADEYVVNLRNCFLHLAKKLNPLSSQIEVIVKESKEGNPKSAAEKLLQLLSQNSPDLTRIEDLGWVLYRYMNIYDGNNEDEPFFNRCLGTYMKVCENKQSLLHSSILNAVLKVSLKKNFQFDKFFIESWGPENLRKDDYQDNIYDGKTYPSLFYKICSYFVEGGISFRIDSFCERTGNNPIFVANVIRRCWFWRLYRESKTAKSEHLWTMFNEYSTTLSAYGASEWHSKILTLAFMSMVEQDSYRILPFFVAWGHNFSEPDWKPSVGKDGKEYAPIAERVIKASYDALNESGVKQRDYLVFMISALTEAVERNPSDEWNKRRLGRLYYMNGDKLNAETIYQDLSKILYDKYYYWQEYSQIIDEPAVKAGMLSKALLIESNENYIGDIRLEIASYLISIGNKEAASTELELYHVNRINNGWKIPEKYTSLKKTIGDTPSTNGNNKKLYQSMAEAADEFVYKDLPWEYFVLADSWKTEDNKSFVMLTDGKGYSIKAKRHSHKMLIDAHIGQTFCVKIEHETNKLLLIESSSSEDWSVLPEAYAYVEYVNIEKNVAHSITADNKAVYFHFDSTKPICKNSFVKVRYFEKERRDKDIKLKVVSWIICKKEEALPSFRNKVVVVDDVNTSKNLFHFILGRGLIGGIVRYSETELRPKIGDFIKVYYCVTNDKSGKKIVQIINVEATEEEAEGMIFTTTGFVEVKYDRNGHQFGFINNYYVPEELIHDSACKGRVEARVLNIQAGKEKVFEIKPIE